MENALETKNNKSGAVLMDLRAAYDTVWNRVQAAEIFTGKTHGSYNYWACPEQKFHSYHRWQQI